MDAFKFYKTLELGQPRYIDTATYSSAKAGDALTPISINPADTYNIDSNPDENKVKSLKNLINRCLAKYPSLTYDSLLNSTNKTLITFSSYWLDAGLVPGSITIIYGANEYTDTYSDGILYNSGNAVGIVAYKEGIILTNTTILENDTQVYAARISNLNTYMTIVHAEKDELNHSNNPTSAKVTIDTEDSRRYKESANREPTNTVKPLSEGTIPDLEKQTFITKVGLYNKNKELIAVATLANPLRKTENREFTFKLKLDI